MSNTDFMMHERRKAVIKAIGELEVALYTFNYDGDFKGLQNIYDQLVSYKKDNLD